MINTIFFKQMELLIEVLPFVALEENFALKGGTAINLFLRNLPRLSVDIDLTYSPIEVRDLSLKKITEGMLSIKRNLESKMDLMITKIYLPQTNFVCKLLIQKRDVRIKIEMNLILRGHVFPCETKTSCKEAEKLFSREVSVKTMSFQDIYAGKLCAALDRQHPRDLFDVKMLVKNEGISDPLWQAFLIYLSSGDRPIYEMISPNKIDIRNSFNKEFLHMSSEIVSLEELESTRESLIRDVQNRIKENGFEFLVSLLEGDPNWDQLKVSHAHELPGIKWKLLNIKKMNTQKRKEQLNEFVKIIEAV